MKRLPDYLAVLHEVLKKQPEFSVSFRGVTSSPEAVMIQGYPVGTTLAQIREDLRTTLTARGIGECLDRRYKIVTAHLTVARYFTTMDDWRPLKSLLAANRQRDFGTTCFRSLQLIEGDWYASMDSVRTLQEFPLNNLSANGSVGHLG